jgi:hypothetical protein
MLVEFVTMFPIKVPLIVHTTIIMTQIEVVIIAYSDYVRAYSLNSMPCNLFEIRNGALSHDLIRKCSCFVQETSIYFYGLRF